MADQTLRGGIIGLTLDGEVLEPKGDWTYNTGQPKRSAIVGTSAVHGFKSEPQTAYAEGAITDRGDLDVAQIKNTVGATLVLTLANGKTVVFRNAWWASEGDTTTGEGEIAARFEAVSAEEIPAA